MHTYLPVVHLDPAAISTQIHKDPQRSTQIHTAFVANLPAGRPLHLFYASGPDSESNHMRYGG